MTADTIGGVWMYTLDLARALGRHGVAVHVATMGEPLDEVQWAQAQSVSNVTVYESTFKLEWMDAPWDDVAAAGAWLLDLAAQLQPDIIHLNGYTHAALPWAAPVVVVAHSCVLSWWEAVHGEHAPPEWDYYRTVVSRGLHAATLVVAPSQAMLDALQRHYGALEHTVVIANGHSAPMFASGNKDPMILAAGRLWDAAKNTAALDAVAPHIRWPIYVAGTPQHPDGTIAQHSHVVPLGKLSRDELTQWYKRAAIYALPARYEPFGLSVLEAALEGCALVLGDIPSLREIWGEAALYVPPNDPEMLQNALEWLIDDGYVRAAFAGRAYERACGYTVQRMVNGYLTAYRSLLDTQTRTVGGHPTAWELVSF